MYQQVTRNIDAITVSVGYADFLCRTLPLFKAIFDRVLVITSPTDEATKRVCKHNNTDYFICETLQVNFNKGKALNEGLSQLKPEDWACFVDADILLPQLARPLLRSIELSKECLYGIDRLMCNSFESYDKFLRSPVIQYEQSRNSDLVYMRASPFPIGARVLSFGHGGFVIPGYFQLWHSSIDRMYPECYDNAAGSDLEFCYKWGRQHRHLLPEIVGIHIATDQREGANWYGRRSPEFKPADIFDVTCETEAKYG